MTKGIKKSARMHGDVLVGMQKLRGWSAYRLVGWNGGSTSLAGVADVSAAATLTRSHELLQAPEEVAKGRGWRGECALRFGGGKFSPDSVW